MRTQAQFNTLKQVYVSKAAKMSAIEIAKKWKELTNDRLAIALVRRKIGYYRDLIGNLMLEKRITEAEYNAYFKDGGHVELTGSGTPHDDEHLYGHPLTKKNIADLKDINSYIFHYFKDAASTNYGISGGLITGYNNNKNKDFDYSNWITPVQTGIVLRSYEKNKDGSNREENKIRSIFFSETEYEFDKRAAGKMATFCKLLKEGDYIQLEIIIDNSSDLTRSKELKVDVLKAIIYRGKDERGNLKKHYTIMLAESVALDNSARPVQYSVWAQGGSFTLKKTIPINNQYVIKVMIDSKSNSNYGLFANIFRKGQVSPIMGRSFKDNSTNAEILAWGRESMAKYDEDMKNATSYKDDENPLPFAEGGKFSVRKNEAYTQARNFINFLDSKDISYSFNDENMDNVDDISSIELFVVKKDMNENPDIDFDTKAAQYKFKRKSKGSNVFVAIENLFAEGGKVNASKFTVWNNKRANPKVGDFVKAPYIPTGIGLVVGMKDGKYRVATKFKSKPSLSSPDFILDFYVHIFKKADIETLPYDKVPEHIVEAYSDYKFAEGGKLNAVEIQRELYNARHDLSSIKSYRIKLAEAELADVILMNEFQEKVNAGKLTEAEAIKEYKASDEYKNLMKLIEQGEKYVKQGGKGQFAEGGNLASQDRIDEIFNNYLIAALWSSNDPDTDEPLDSEHGIEDIDPDTTAKLKAAVTKYVNANLADIDASELTDEEFGHSLWLTQNHHGSGFFDYSMDEDVEKRLTDAADKLGEVDLYVGDDGMVYGDNTGSIDPEDDDEEFAEGGKLKSYGELKNLISKLNKILEEDAFGGKKPAKITISNIFGMAKRAANNEVFYTIDYGDGDLAVFNMAKIINNHITEQEMDKLRKAINNDSFAEGGNLNAKDYILVNIDTEDGANTPEGVLDIWDNYPVNKITKDGYLEFMYQTVKDNDGKLYLMYSGGDYDKYKDQIDYQYIQFDRTSYAEGGKLKAAFGIYGQNGEYYITDRSSGSTLPSATVSHHIGKPNRFKSKKEALQARYDLMLHMHEEQPAYNYHPREYDLKFAEGGNTKPKTDYFRYLELEQKSDGNLKITLTDEGKEKVAEDGLTFDNSDEYWDDVQGNSEWMFFEDSSQAQTSKKGWGFGLTEAPVVLDGWYYDDNGIVTHKGHKDHKEYFYTDYQIRDMWEVLARDGEVELQGNFEQGGTFAKGGAMKITFDKLNSLISEINEQGGGKFSLGGAYGYQELWAILYKDGKEVGSERVESGSKKDIYQALVKNRYNKKFQPKYAEGNYAEGGKLNTGRVKAKLIGKTIIWEADPNSSIYNKYKEEIVEDVEYKKNPQTTLWTYTIHYKNPDENHFGSASMLIPDEMKELLEKGTVKQWHMGHSTLTIKDYKPKLAEGGTIDSYYQVRKDLRKNEEAVSIGSDWVLEGKWKGRWVGEDEDELQLFHNDQWQDVESIDFEKVKGKHLAEGGTTITKLGSDYIGYSVSHATLKQEHLIETFLQFLDAVKAETGIEEKANKLEAEAEELEKGEDDDYTDSEAAGYILEEISDLIDSIAPEGTSFQAHEGDGSDFGFWEYENDDDDDQDWEDEGNYKRGGNLEGKGIAKYKNWSDIEEGDLVFSKEDAEKNRTNDYYHIYEKTADNINIGYSSSNSWDVSKDEFEKDYRVYTYKYWDIKLGMGSGHYAKGGDLASKVHSALGTQHYVKWFYNQWANYDVKQIAAIVEKAGGKNVHTENEFGWSNQPEVVVFNTLSPSKIQEALVKELDNDYVTVYKKNWKKTKMAEGGDIASTEIYDQIYNKYKIGSGKGTKKDYKLAVDFLVNHPQRFKESEESEFINERYWKLFKEAEKFSTGFKPTFVFNKGDKVYDKEHKVETTVINNYDDPINGDGGELRTSHDGNVNIFTYDYFYNRTGYNLTKLSNKGEKHAEGGDLDDDDNEGWGDKVYDDLPEDYQYMGKIADALKAAGITAEASYFDQYQGAYIKTPKQKFWVMDMFVRGKAKPPKGKYKNAIMYNTDGDPVSASSGDYFELPKTHVFKGFTLNLFPHKGDREIIKNPKVSDLPDITAVSNYIEYDGTPDDVIVLQNEYDGEDAFPVEVVINPQGEVDATELIDFIKGSFGKGGKLPKHDMPKHGTPEWHELQIAKRTVKMSEVGAMLMGGQTMEHAKKVMERYGLKYAKGGAFFGNYGKDWVAWEIANYIHSTGFNGATYEKLFNHSIAMDERINESIFKKALQKVIDKNDAFEKDGKYYRSAEAAQRNFAKGGNTTFFKDQYNYLPEVYSTPFKLKGNGSRLYNIFQSHRDDQLRQAARQIMPQLTKEEHKFQAKHYGEMYELAHKAYSKAVDTAFMNKYNRKPDIGDYKVSGIWDENLLEADKNIMRENLKKQEQYKAAADFHQANTKYGDGGSFAEGGSMTLGMYMRTINTPRIARLTHFSKHSDYLCAFMDAIDENPAVLKKFKPVVQKAVDGFLSRSFDKETILTKLKRDVTNDISLWRDVVSTHQRMFDGVATLTPSLTETAAKILLGGIVGEFETDKYSLNQYLTPELKAEVQQAGAASGREKMQVMMENKGYAKGGNVEGINLAVFTKGSEFAEGGATYIYANKQFTIQYKKDGETRTRYYVSDDRDKIEKSFKNMADYGNTDYKILAEKKLLIPMPEGVYTEDITKFAEGGNFTPIDKTIATAIFEANSKAGKIETSFGNKTIVGLTEMVNNDNYSCEEVAQAIFDSNEHNGKVNTSHGSKNLDGLTMMIMDARKLSYGDNYSGYGEGGEVDNQFVDYVYSYYGKDGIFQFKPNPATKEEIRKATKEYRQGIGAGEGWGGGDSVDRELVRDIMLKKRGVKPDELGYAEGGGLKLQSFNVVNASGDIIDTVEVAVGTDSQKYAAEKLKFKYPQGYPLLKLVKGNIVEKQLPNFAEGGNLTINDKYKSAVLRIINYKINKRLGDVMSDISYTEAINLKDKIQSDKPITKEELQYIKHMAHYLDRKRIFTDVTDISYTESFDFYDNITKYAEGGGIRKKEYANKQFVIQYTTYGNIHKLYYICDNEEEVWKSVNQAQMNWKDIKMIEEKKLSKPLEKGVFQQDMSNFAEGGSFKRPNIKMPENIYQKLAKDVEMMVEHMGRKDVKEGLDQKPMRTMWGVYNEVTFQRMNDDNHPSLGKNPARRVLAYDKDYYDKYYNTDLNDTHVDTALKSIFSQIFKTKYDMGGNFGNLFAEGGYFAEGGAFSPEKLKEAIELWKKALAELDNDKEFQAEFDTKTIEQMRTQLANAIEWAKEKLQEIPEPKPLSAEASAQVEEPEPAVAEAMADEPEPEPEPEPTPAEEEAEIELTKEDYQASIDGAMEMLEFTEGEQKQELQDFIDGLKTMIDFM